MKNKLSLTTILGIFLLSAVLFGVVCCLALSDELFGRSFSDGRNSDFYFFFGFLFFTLLFFFITIGVFNKAEWARTLLLWNFYLAIVCFSFFVIINLESSMRRIESFIAGFGFAVMAYCFLFGAVLFLQSKAVKEEFGIAEDID